MYFKEWLIAEEVRKKLFVLVGPPAVGKSTWIKNTFSGIGNPYIISRDDIVEKIAHSYGWNYDEMYAGPPEDAVVGDIDQKYGEVVPSPTWMTWQRLSFFKVLEANYKVGIDFKTRVAEANGRDNIIVDMTNVDKEDRAKALSFVGNDYEKIAIVFEFHGAEDIIQKVVTDRAEAAKRMGKNKTIPAAAVTRMFAAFERPTKDEGFDIITSVDNRELLRKLVG